MKKTVYLFLFCFSLVGCGTGLVKSFVDAPQVRGIELKSFSVKENQAVFEIALFNPNSFSLPLSGLIADIKLNQMAIGHVDIKSDESLAAKTTQNITVPIMLNSGQLVKAIRSVVKLKQAHYSLKGGVKVSVGEIPFSKEGELSIEDLIFALFNSLF